MYEQHGNMEKIKKFEKDMQTFGWVVIITLLLILTRCILREMLW